MNSFQALGTFGFELEFLMLFRESGSQASLAFKGKDSDQTLKHPPEEPSGLTGIGDGDHTIHMKRIHYFGAEVAKKLADAGTATVYREKSHPKDDKPLNPDDEEAELGSFDDFRYGAYKENTIVPEDTMIWTDPAASGKRMAVRPETPEGHFWLGFEFVSKAYRYRDFESTKSDLEILCRTLRGNYFVSVNAGKDSKSASSRCGTHVHWGLGGRQYDLSTVKRVLTLMWMAEDKLMDLHASWRQDANKYVALLRRGANMAIDNTPKLPNWIGNLGEGEWMHEMDQNVPLGDQHNPKLQWIWRAETVDDLAMLIGEPKKLRRGSIGIMELLPAASDFAGKVRRSQLNTIEFRHMQGSLDPALIAAWIAVTAEIMSQCISLTPKDFKGLLQHISESVSIKGLTVQELLSALGVKPDVCNVFKSFDQHRLDHEADPKVSVFLPEL
ncbi:hypothetical protein M426DRAFT_9204 [Hypoxylon sp. CI-4A]|nr:hypothetical protein M426DRAFT_9204 [Hypoxylon sp. CI-4A]